MRELALFAGAGGGILGGVLLGWRTVCAVEIDPYCREVLMRRQDEGHLSPFPIWDNIRTFRGYKWKGLVDVVSAGFPCQPFSTASRGRKTATDLWPELVRVVNEVQPRFIYFENVLDSAYPRNTRAALFPCCPAEMGAPHHRERYWLAANAYDKNEPTRPKHDEAPGIQASADVNPWQDGPDSILGVDDGPTNRMDRARAIGNAQVPLVAATAWHLLTQDNTGDAGDGASAAGETQSTANPSMKGPTAT